MIALAIQPGSDIPIYRQIARQVAAAIAGGRLAPGARLSSHRELAEALVVAPLTVKKAYDELEHEGWIETRRGQGTFVVRKPPSASRAAARDRLQPLVDALLAEAESQGLDVDEVIKLLRAARARSPR